MQLTKSRSLKEGYQICTRCIYDTSVPNIVFDTQGVCNYCKQTDELAEEFGTGKEKGEKLLDGFVEQIKKAGKNKKYDCIIGISGGTDSSFQLYWAKMKGLRPLAVHYDNTFNTDIATSNITKMTKKLDIDLYTYVVNNTEMEDIYRSFFLADVPEIDAASDLAVAEVLYRIADKFKVKYVIEGHSFIEEGVTPLGKNYFDGKYISSIHKQFGKLKMKTFPNMPFWTFVKWVAFKRIKKIRPYWYLSYSKEEAQKLLKEKFEWENYGGHHLENRMNAFSHSIYYPQKFGIDYRNNTLSAKVRNRQMDRDKAIEIYYEQLPHIETGLLDYMKKRMGFSDEEFDKIMASKPKYWFEYPNYKKRFERLRPFFFMLYKSNLVPKSFYMKYCLPVDTSNNGEF